MGPRPPAYRVMYLQTNLNEQIRPFIVSDKEKENYICSNGQNLSYWNKYFVIYPHKCTLNNFKKKYQEKWENAYLTAKNARASRALRRALDPGQYWLTSLAQLRFTTSATSRKTFLGPPLDQILDPLVSHPVKLSMPDFWTWRRISATFSLRILQYKMHNWGTEEFVRGCDEIAVATSQDSPWLTKQAMHRNGSGSAISRH